MPTASDLSPTLVSPVHIQGDQKADQCRHQQKRPEIREEYRGRFSLLRSTFGWPGTFVTLVVGSAKSEG